MYEEYSDQEIIELHKKGDVHAFAVLVNRYSKSIYNFVFRLNKNSAEDIVQEIFLKAWKKINSFNIKKASFKTWIFTIARNTIIDFSRKKREVLFSELEEKDEDNFSNFYENIPSSDVLPDEALQKLSDLATLNKTMEKINPKYKEILIFYYQEDLTFEEIGKILNKSTNTIKSQHRRALEQIRLILQNAPK
jgi:RNA polymerase sigma factor (sigma-70 family)